MNTRFAKHNSEQGASLLIALIFMTGLFAIVTSTLTFSMNRAGALDKLSTAGQDVWTARGYSSRAAAWAQQELPNRFQTDLARARMTCPDQSLPAFNPPGDRDSLPCVKSLLGDVGRWLARHAPVAARLARGDAAEDQAVVKVRLTEAYRRTAAEEPVPFYVVNYLIDARFREANDRQQGLIALNDFQVCMATASLAADHLSVPAGTEVMLAVQFTGLTELKLFANGMEVPGTAAAVPYRTGPSTHIFPRQRVDTAAKFTAVGRSIAAGCETSSQTVAIVIEGAPPPEPTPPAGS